jgi:hypothetical protein
MFFLSQKTKKRSVIALIGVVLGVYVFGFTLFRPVTTYAQFTDVNQGLRNVTDNIGDALLAAGLGALVNGASYFMRKVAYDTAKYIVSGGKGQGPLAFQEGFGEYLANTALDSAASAIQQFGEPFGLNLCTPPDIRLQIGLQVSLSQIYEAEFTGPGEIGGPQPRCEWNQFKESWENSPDTVFNDQSLLEKFNASLKHSQGDLGVALSLVGKVDNIVATQQLANQLNRLEGEGFKPVSDIISGNIKTPASVIQEETKTLTGNYKTQLDTQQIAGLYGAGAVQILPMALSVFANTLTNALLQNVLEKGIFPNNSGQGGSLDFYASSVNNNRAAAESAFSYLIAGIPQRPLTAYDVVTEYSTCGTNPGLNNCVMDSGLGQALDRARVETPLTIQDALEQNLLHENWPLIPPTREVDNANLQYCHNSAYCFSNIQKLRKARILPLGFEIAVRKSDPDKPWTLGEVVRGFDDCDPGDKFCKLIDPNWILKAPVARCEALVHGPELLTPSASTRRDECVDFSTCLQTDENGQCVGYGYCTQEENTWSIPGQSCPEQFNTCKTYTAESNGAVASYLSRTLDIQSCSADSVGCRSYSADRVGDEWVGTQSPDLVRAFEGRTQVVHFNGNISNQQCPAGAEGCTLFVDPTTEEKVFLKKAPEYLACYDADNTTPNTTEWPETQAELALIAERANPSCSTFASACIAEEIGCDEFRPADGGAIVTGVVGGGACPTQCVGYETFKQEPTEFEQQKFPLNFIAREAETCSIQQVGCDEFTNIGAAATGGESLEYYSSLKHCELPEGNNGKVFYSWEGSEVEGYVLKRHTLLQLTALDASYIGGLGISYESGESSASVFPVGSPAYVDDTRSALENNYGQCNQTAYNVLLENPYSPNAAHPDCRGLYDSSGGIYYRILRDTVTVSAACTPLRKTDSQLFSDANITNATTCAEKAGVWQNNQCNRCMGGGRFEANADGVGGSCIYSSISEEATSCPASANKCRSYIGNTGNNVYEVARFGFEPTGDSVDALNQARAGWGGTVSVEPEALQVGLHSLRVNGTNTGYTFESGRLQAGAWYELRFWARGNASFGLAAGFAQNGETSGQAFTFDPSTNSNVLVPVTAEWQEYKVGPVQFVGNASQPTQLYMSSQALGGLTQFYFLDNISLVQIGGAQNDHIFLIKDSWKTEEGYDVPLACDSTPTNGLPGEYLGCREYMRRDGQVNALTGFERLCRPEAIGCRPLVDTQNTISGIRPEEKQAYGAVCRKSTTATSEVRCEVAVVEGATSSNYGCVVERGLTECRIETSVVVPETATLATDGCLSIGDSCVGAKDKLFIDEGTVVVREDSDMIYLTHRSEFVCNEQQLGCMKVGLEEQNLASDTATAFSYRDTFVKNDPRLYGDTLCSADEVGCSVFRQDNTRVYFKDPKITGNSLCVYKDKVEKNGVEVNGWFMDGVGTCNTTGDLCKTDAECGASGVCGNVGTTACYENFIQPGNSYGLRSQGATDYLGFVGVCDSGANGCTELVDRSQITSSTPEGKSYFVLMNERLTRNIGQCEGKVSQKEGCVLFDMTENPSKSYNTDASYLRSETATPRHSLVAPVLEGERDANIILKVERDRQCREWLACRTSITVQDENGRPQSLCQQYAACRKLGPSGECLEWVDAALDNTRMTEEKYVARETGWNAGEYSGYSFFGTYNPNNFVYLLFEGRTEAYMGYEMSHAFFEEGSGFESQGCRATTGGTSGTYVKQDGALCGFDNGGRCYRQRCIYPIESTFTFTPLAGNTPENVKVNTDNMLKQLQPGICKSYPEPTSPYSVDIAIGKINESDVKKEGDISRVDYTEKKQNYERANVCQPGSTSEDCSCEYIKVEYKSGTTDYWPMNTQEIPGGICVGGEDDGAPCTETSQCGGAGTCSTVKQRGTYVGQKGLCIEYDLSRPLGTAKPTARLHEAFACLTWLPIQTSASSLDIYNTVPESGYYPVTTYDAPQGGGHAYCTESTNRGVGYYNTDLDATANLGKFGGNFYDSDYVVQYNNIILYRDPETGENVHYNSFGSSRTTAIFNSSRPTNYRSAGTDSPYEWLMLNGAASQTSQGKLKIYRAIQAWAWNHIGKSARILRLDTQGGERPKYYYPNESFGELTDVLGFAPLISNGDIPHEDTGTLMHPPRLFENNTQGINLGQYYVNPGDGDWVTVGTSAFSPEIGFARNEQFEKYIEVDEKVESQLNEKDIQSMHFVPIAYPDGAEGDNPAMLTKDMAIDFNRLRAMSPGQNRAYLGDIPAYRDNNNNQNEVCGEQDEGGECLAIDANERMTHVAYLLERGTEGVSGDGLLSYGEYENVSGQYWDKYVANPDMQERTKIHRRYVSFVFSRNETTFTSLSASPARIPAGMSDPFSTTGCETPPNNIAKNWFAIGMDFNKDGEFLGYISRWCMNTRNDGEEANGIRLATIAHMQDRCLEYRAVVDSANQINNNKAWTDRVWKNSTYLAGDSAFLRLLKQEEGAGTAGFAPYGSLNNNPDNPVGVINSKTVSSLTRNELYEFGDYKFGVPFQCQGGDGFGSTVETGNALFGGSLGCAVPDERSNAMVNSIASNSNGGDILAKLFLKYYTGKTFEFGVSIQESEDRSGVVDNTTRPPQIFSINPHTCRERGGNCTAAEADAFTINYRNYTLRDYDGDSIPDEDKNRQDGVDPIIADGVYQATASFFAYADDNRMPLKRVMVKWDDGHVTNEQTDGLYKNRKPYCGATDNFTYSYDSASNSGLGRCSGTLITCSANEDCRFAGPDGNAVSCVRPTQVASGGSASGVCRYSEVEYTGVTCEVATVNQDCQPLQGSTVSCELTGGFSSGSANQGSGFCRYEKIATYTTATTCLSVASCPSLTGAVVRSCDITENSGTSSTLLDRHFGDAPRACTEEYFEFTHVYQCSSADTNATVGSLQVSDPEAYRRLIGRAGFTNDTEICVFRPAVQVVDNWGWCNGTCDDGNGNERNGCYGLVNTEQETGVDYRW